MLSRSDSSTIFMLSVYSAGLTVSAIGETE
jgi:hypothetical protein